MELVCNICADSEVIYTTQPWYPDNFKFPHISLPTNWNYYWDLGHKLVCSKHRITTVDESDKR